MNRQAGRALAHLLGFHTPECLQTNDPRRTSQPWKYPACQRTRAVAHVPRGLRWLGWHRWVTR